MLAGKTRTTRGDEPVIEWERRAENDRALVIGDPTWREYTLRCRVQALQAGDGPTYDEPRNGNARAGLIFRMETLRRYYTLCIENQRRLVLYRRNDEEWHELAARDVPEQEQVLTLSVTLDGDGEGTKKPVVAIQRTPDSTHLLGLQLGETIHLFGPK